MQVRHCTNAKCLRPYRIRKNENLSGEFRSGKLNCPHCGHIEALWEGEAFSLLALTAEQEAAFSRRGGHVLLFSRHAQAKPLAVRAALINTLLAKPFSYARKNH